MEFNTAELLEELSQKVQSHLDFANSLQLVSEAQLNGKKDSKSWSALECLEHLNLYGHFYIPEIKKRMNASSASASATFKSGRLGNKFANDMLPKKGMKTMKTFKNKNPIHSKLEASKVLGTFVQQQHEFLKLLQQAESKNLTKIKTAITLPLLKLRLGDTFRFVIYHNERHVVQAKNALNSQK
jgi:hypothetical protein